MRINEETRLPVGCMVSGLIAVLSLLCSQASGTDSRLPDGTEYVPWEKPLTFSKTYYVDNTSARADDNGPGTSEQPFRTINKAAQVLQPGERVVIASGTYRECVRPARGGTGPDKMISYEAAPGAKVFVKGSDVLNSGWTPGGATSRGGGSGGGGGGQVRTWRHDLPGAMFPDGYNPFALASIPGDWAWLDTKRVDMGPYFRRRGLVFVDGKPLEPMEQSGELGNTALRSWIPTLPQTNLPTSRGGLPVRIRGGAIMQEVGGSPDARFYAENPGNGIQIRVPDDTPTNALIEITIREQAFVPLERGLGYIRVKGITFQHGGNGYPPPQRGLVSTAAGHHWIIEGNTIEWANGVGLDIGSGGFGGGGGGGGRGGGAANSSAAGVTNSGTAGVAAAGTGGSGRAGAGRGGGGAAATSSGASHIIRGNTIRYCGVCGVCGAGTRNVLVEDNLLEWCGWADAERAWEAAAAKFHGAQSMIFRRNVVRHIRHANAVWLDSNNANCRITGNVLADILSVSAAIHMEMNRSYNQIDNNIIWNVRNAEPGTPGQRGAAGSGVFIHATDRVLIAQNLFGLCDNSGVWPVLRPERGGAGNGQENYVYNNIFASCGKSGIVFLSPTNESGGNVFVSMPASFLVYIAGETNQVLDLPAWRQHGWDTNSVVADIKLGFDADRLELTMSTANPLPKFALFNHNDTDILGAPTGETRVPGPIADPGASRVRPVDPRHALKQETASARQ
jgi:hypothetical protein